MNIARIFTRASFGVDAPLVTVEVHISNGLSKFNLVGLAQTAVRESKDRVRSAILTSQFEFPLRKITVNLAPADLPKEGARFDLALAIGILFASSQLEVPNLSHYEFIGELGLTGEIKPVRGMLPIALAASQSGRILIIPQDNAKEAGLSGYANIFHANHLLDVCAFLLGKKELPRCDISPFDHIPNYEFDLLDVHGQFQAKKALAVAAAGRHSLLFMGPPGTGKTLLAQCLRSILPPLTEQQAKESCAIRSLNGEALDIQHWRCIPFRAPHHSCSPIALVGGSRPPKAGEVSLAHQGILFLDELPEFHRVALECLREPLEAKHITISRAAYQIIFPADFLFLAAMNPCPCGFAGSMDVNCKCSPSQIQRYWSRLSGPLLDRLDLQVTVPKLPPEYLFDPPVASESSAAIREQVCFARERQIQRQGKLNSALSPREILHYIQIEESARDLLQSVMKQFHLSARVYHRILKVAQTLVDLAGETHIQKKQMSEALQLRILDRNHKK